MPSLTRCSAEDFSNDEADLLKEARLSFDLTKEQLREMTARWVGAASRGERDDEVADWRQELAELRIWAQVFISERTAWQTALLASEALSKTTRFNDSRREAVLKKIAKIEAHHGIVGDGMRAEHEASDEHKAAVINLRTRHLASARTTLLLQAKAYNVVLEETRKKYHLTCVWFALLASLFLTPRQ